MATNNRRHFLKGATGIGGGIAVASFANIFGLRDAFAQSADRQDDVQTIVNLAATAETLAATAYYYSILNNPVGYNSAALAYFKYALSAELYHLNFLQSAGGKSLTQQFYVPAQFLKSKAVNNGTFQAAETAFVGAYLAATRRFAELGNPRLAATTAQHAASENEHLALQRQANNELPNPNALPAPIFYNVSDAVPVLGPFLSGGEGFIGPVEYPGDDAVRRVAGVEAVQVPVFLSVF